MQWGDALCRRALDEALLHRGCGELLGRFPGGAGPWHSYLPELPGADPSGSLYGTLCAASAEQKPLTAGSDHLIAFFARLIAEQVEREQLLQQLQQANHELSRQALSDPLTGLPNRRALMHELNRLFSLAERVEHPLLLGFIDLDGFKAINDTHGHDTGDLLLQRVAAALSTVLRGSDLLARVGATSSWRWEWGRSAAKRRGRRRCRAFSAGCSRRAWCSSRCPPACCTYLFTRTGLTASVLPGWDNLSSRCTP